ncbi:TPA: hypothetical protein QEL09_002371 [Stenotrophomonas maltophilia]|nr:hypothetical protein [Stenotrophomonas maltophilia]
MARRYAIRTRWTFQERSGSLVTVPVQSRLMVNQSEPLLAAAVAGFGLILQPLKLVKDALSAGTLIEVLPSFRSPTPALSVLYARDRHLTPKLQSFIDFCTEEFNEKTLTER